jgi:hypothetical protein
MTQQAILIEEFKKYVERFEEMVGSKEFGEYGTWNQYVVKKLNFDEFIAKYEEFVNFKKLYADILERGDTVNDAIFRTLQESGSNIIIDIK